MQPFGGATPLMYACQQCKENQVLDILTKQPYAVKDRDRTLKTPLHYCAENPNTSCAEIILKFAPELVNAQDENGYSTLHLAVIAGNKSLIKFLIAKGADVNIYDNEGHSAVHWAIVSSEKEALEIIIRAGANPSTPDIHGGYPLHYAVQMCGSTGDYIRNYEDTVRVVETLLNFGVDVNVKDKDGRQPILWAASAGSADAVVHLVSGGACVEAADKDGLTALHCAASRGHTTTLDTLITLCGTNVDVIDGNGCSALFYSVTLGHADATEVLLELGAEPNRQDRKGRTPAHCGAAKGQLETLRILQKHGGNLWLRNVKGDIPLHEAVASGRKDLVLWLLSQNSDAVNIANNDGRCPLHIAAMYNNTEMVKILLDAKSLVNPIMRTSKGVLMTPLNVALCKGHRSCGKYLQLHGGVPFSKVAKIEPASAFAFRVSPSTEIINNSSEINIDSLQISKAKVSASNTSTDAPIRTETSDKKKIYRRRKKRKTFKTDSHESDSDENVQNTKIKTSESRKNAKEENEEVEEETDENDENIRVKKVHLGIQKKDKNTKEKASKTNSVNIKSTKAANDVGVQETVTVKRVAKAKTEPKPLPRTKSLKESKNVSNLSPDDFPPLMQAVNQLDSVIIEPEIDMSKTPNEYDTEGGLRVPIPSVDELSGNEQTTDVLEKEVEISNTENKGNYETPENRKAEEDKVSKEIEKNRNETLPQKDEKSEKPVTKQKVDVKKNETTFQSTESKYGEGSGQKSEKSTKSPASKSSSDEVKKGDKTFQSGTQKVTSSDKNDKAKKSTISKTAKSNTIIPTNENFDKKVEKTEMKILEEQLENSELKEENVLISVETKAEVGTSENEKPEVSRDEGGMITYVENKQEEKLDTVPEIEDVKYEKRDEKSEDVGNKEVSNLEIKNPYEKLTTGSNETPIKKNEDEEDVFDLSLVQLSESPQQPFADEKSPKERRSPAEKGNFPDGISTEEQKHENKIATGKSQLTNPSAEPSGLDIKILEFEKTDLMVPEHLQDDLMNLGPPATFKQENLDVEEHKFAEVLPEEKPKKVDSPEVIKTPSGEEEISKDIPINVSENSKPEDTGDRNNNNEADESANSNGKPQKEMNNDNEQRHYKPPKVPRLCRRHKDFKYDTNQASVTQLVQSTLKKYHMERGIFYQLLELKRYQIRSGKANEQVLVKRLADEYERSRIFLGMKPYSGLYKFREFEKFLYDQLKALNNRRSFIIPEIKSYDDIDALSGFLKKSRYKIFSEIPQPEMVCTCITQRCHHSACAYTSVPCSAYIADIRHHKEHRKRKECFFPRINQPEVYKPENQKYTEQPATLELIQGNQKHVITLPHNYPQKSKRYYVTFTIKAVTSPKEEDEMDSRNYFKHRHAKSV